ncbi:MAG: hypothetical protein JXA67_13470 [Micromonosporaceae bacterium]|nr:hypothetical protein [Micromonosporaceae bacterium]
MPRTEPEPALMIKFCGEMLPTLLQDVCQVEPAAAASVGSEILDRADAFATLDRHDQDVLVGPFVEEAVDHVPADASLALKAAVTLVVRNSRLEDLHVRGLVSDGGLRAITEMAAVPLSHVIAARRRQPQPVSAENLFRGLAGVYPRAWACLAALAGVLDEGGRCGYRAPEAPVADLPSGADVIDAAHSQSDDTIVVRSGVDERFDAVLVARLRDSADEQGVLFVSALSRLSRHTGKLLRIIEYLLAHDVPILTTNYLLRPRDVWVRRGRFVKPTSAKPLAGLVDERGLAGTHRNLAREIRAQLG